MTGAVLDHLAVAAADLAAGVAHVEAALGVPTVPGGQHAAMGTHNRLLSLGLDTYLEAIAIDPAAQPPGRTRWFDLDNFEGGPRLSNWVLRCENLNAALALSPPGTGVPMALARGDLRWSMAVPEDGRLPFDGVFPALIEWEGAAHPAPRLPDTGLRLRRLILRHPQPEALQAALARLTDDPRIAVEPGAPGLAAEIDTPAGPRLLA